MDIGDARDTGLGKRLYPQQAMTRVSDHPAIPLNLLVAQSSWEAATMLEMLATLTLDIPYDGLSRIAGMGFALEQFARAQGCYSFGEWAAEQFQKGRSITASVVKSDELDTSIIPKPGRTVTAFGYEVTVWVSASGA